jgi:hypothetical protein
MVGLRQFSQIQLFYSNYLVAERETFQKLYYTTFRANPNANPNIRVRLRVSKKKISNWEICRLMLIWSLFLYTTILAASLLTLFDIISFIWKCVQAMHHFQGQTLYLHCITHAVSPVRSLSVVQFPIYQLDHFHEFAKGKQGRLIAIGFVYV